MRRVLWVCLVLLLAAGSVLPAHAANAEFQGNCTNIPGTPLRTDCVFNATRTPSGSSPTGCTSPYTITNYFWDYGDGTDSGFTSSSSTSHSYFGASSWDICLSVFCSDGSSDTTCHCMVNNVGINGCILPGGGWLP